MKAYFVALTLIYDTKINASASIIFADDEQMAIDSTLSMIDPAYKLITSSVMELREETLRSLIAYAKENDVV